MTRGNPNFRRLLRNLRKQTEELESNAKIITVQEDCPECHVTMEFEFRDVPHAQTGFKHCWKCGELIRFRWQRNAKSGIDNSE